MKRNVLAVCAVVAMFGLSACTPEEISAVENAYRASIEAERTEAPTWSVEADCDGAHVRLTGWTGVTDISPSTGIAYAILGLGAMPTHVDLDSTGSADSFHPSATPGQAVYWNLLINGEPGLDVGGIANC